ncbi:MAG: TrgA family protein [Celeribacter sp.]|jgi:hypothetical protein
MPTASRLVAAIAFAALLYVASDLFVRLLPDGRTDLSFPGLNAGIGALCGWLVMGRLAGRGYGKALESGIRTAATAVFWALVIWCSAEMISHSMAMRYDGPTEAVVAVFDLMLNYGRLLGTDLQVMVTLLAGSLLGGLLAEWASHRFD